MGIRAEIKEKKNKMGRPLGFKTDFIIITKSDNLLYLFAPPCPLDGACVCISSVLFSILNPSSFYFVLYIFYPH